MSLQPAVIENFGGLDLRNDPEQSACIDLLNVEFDREGRVRTRTGFTAFNAAAADPFDVLQPYDANATLVASRGSTAVVFSGGGTSLATQAMAAAARSMVQFGTPTASYVYIANGNDTLWRLSTLTFSQPAGLPRAAYLAVTPYDARLVAAGTTTAAHRVHFSDPGAPDTFGANNYVDLDPGSGTGITGAISWQDSVFVFKGDAFYRFYGTSTDSTGGPVFNYNAVRGIGALSGEHRITQGIDGVFFVGSDGDVYQTTGGQPRRVTETLGDFFSTFGASSNGFFTGSATSLRLAYMARRLYISTASGMFVFDFDSQAWTYWNIPATSMVVWNPSGSGNVLYFGHLTGKYIGKLDGASTDNGTAIASKYRAGFGDFGTPGVEKTIRETELVGSGTPLMAWSRDFGAPATGVAVTLGTSPAVARGRHRVAVRGQVLSWQVSATSGAWSLNRVTAFMRDQRPAPDRTS